MLHRTSQCFVLPTEVLRIVIVAKPDQSRPMATTRKRFEFIFLLFLGLFVGMPAIPAYAQEKLVIDRVFLVPDPKSTAVQFQMIVLAGSADEAAMTQLGIAHYLEHLVLVGRNDGMTDTAQRFFADGMANGWTNPRATGYIHRFPANVPDVNDRLDRLFRFYSQRLTDFAITPEDAVRERNVVRQEHDVRYAGSATEFTLRDANSYLFEGHPLSRFVIGSPETIAAFTVEEARGFLRRWYRKSNVYFIVTGPVSEEQVKTAAEKFLIGLDASPPPARTWPGMAHKVTPGAQEFRKQDKRIGTPTVSISRLFNASETDPLRNAAIASVISGYLSSKLAGSPHDRLVEGDAPVAAAVMRAGISRALPGVFSLSMSGVPEEGRTVVEVRKAFDDYLAEFAKRGIDQAVLDRLKRRYARDLQRDLDEPQNAPGRLITWLTLPLPHESMKDWPKAIAAVTVDEINAVLQAMGKDAREAVVIFEPQAE
jgi:zinc protease